MGFDWALTVCFGEVYGVDGVSLVPFCFLLLRRTYDFYASLMLPSPSWAGFRLLR